MSSEGPPWNVHHNPVAGIRRKCIDRLPGDLGQGNLQLLHDLNQLLAEKHRLIWLAKLR